MRRRELGLLLVGALIARVAYDVIALRGYAPMTDALHYHQLAVAVAEGRGLVHPFPTGEVHPTAFRPPLWPLLLGGVYAVTGPSLGVAQAVTAALGALAVVGVALLADRLAGRTPALVTGGVAAAHPVLVSGDAPPLSEPLGGVLLVGLLLSVSSRRPALAGLLAGLLLLTRPSAQAVVLALAVALLVLWGWRRCLLTLGVAALVVTPWLARNAVQLGGPVLATSTGFNLAASYSPVALEAGGFVDAVYDDRFASVRARAEVPSDAPPGALEAALVSEFREEGLAGLRADPLAPLQVVGKNVPRLLALPGDPAARSAEIVDGRPLAVQPFVHAVGLGLLVVGAAGMVLLARRRGLLAAPLLLVAASVPAASLLTVAAPRLRQPLDLLACVGVGVLLPVAWAWWRTRSGTAREAPAVPASTPGSPGPRRRTAPVHDRADDEGTAPRAS